MYKKELPRVSPESVGISSRRVQALIRDLEAATEMHGFMLARHGKVAAECWWSPYTADLPHICYSLGKSYVATAVALAIRDGLMSVEDSIADIFADDIRELRINPSENLKALRVKHLLTMSNGMAKHPVLNEHLVRNYLTEPVVYEPGTRFIYNTAGTSMLGEIVTRITGKNLHEYMGEALFEPVGIERDKLLWLPYKNGLDASPGIASTTENNLRLGLLYLNGGVWEGKRYLPEDYARAATSPQIDNAGNGGSPDSTCGYGYQIWMCRVPGAYRFDGGNGQLTYVYPARDLVIAINQSGMMPCETERVMKLLADFMGDVEGDGELREDEKAVKTLRRYSDSRALEAGTTTALPSNLHALDGLYKVCAGEFHLYPETRVNDKDNWDRAFYDIDDEYCHTLSIRALNSDEIELTLNHYTRLVARLDGKLTPTYSKNAMPTYDVTCATGYFDGSNTLIVHMRWLHTCLTSTIRLTRYSNELYIEVVKETLHESSPRIHYIARARTSE